MKQFLRRIWAEVRGAEIAEAAAVLPLVFMFFLGIYWFGLAYNAYSTVNHAAREAAKVAAAPSCATCTPAACHWVSTSGPTSFPCDTPVIQAVTDALNAAHLDPGNLVTYTPTPAPAPSGNCSTTSNVTICRSVLLSAPADPVQQLGVTVSFQYKYQMYFPFSATYQFPYISVSRPIVNLSASAELPMEY